MSSAASSASASGSVSSFAISGDEQERDRINLERNLLATLDRHPLFSADEDDEDERDDDRRRQRRRPGNSYERRGEEEESGGGGELAALLSVVEEIHTNLQKAAARAERVEKLVEHLERKLGIFAESATNPNDPDVSQSYKTICQLEAEYVV